MIVKVKDKLAAPLILFPILASKLSHSVVIRNQN